jgi:C-methyltransferase C-terminal domain/Putative zinc binding domain/Methyltransferase domain
VAEVTIVTRCGSCGDDRLCLVLDLGSQPLAERDNGKRYPLRLLRCVNCDLVQLSHVVDPQEVFPENHPYASGNTRALREHFAGLAKIVAVMAGPGDLVAEIASNDGTFLEALREADSRMAFRETPLRLLGVEPTGQAEKCAAKGITTERAFFTAALGRALRRKHGPAKVIVAANVIAHVPDLHSFMEGILALLDDDGTLVIEAHDWASIANGLQADTIYGEHDYYFSVASLSYLLAHHGLLVQEVQPIPTHGGSFRVFAVCEQPDLASRAQQAAFSLHMLMEDAVRDGPVYGIGATTRATPLIHYTGIAGYLAYVVEVPGSEKIGTCIPGTSIPVVDEAKLIEDQPPTALLLSWHIADSIVPALRAKGYRGRFIVPLPEARFLDDQ